MQRSALKLLKVPKPTAAETEALMDSLFKSKSRASVLSVRKKYQEHFLPKILQDGLLPEPLINLKSEKYMDMDSIQLRNKCIKIYDTLTVTKEQSRNVERLTREQAKSNEWHRLRMERITATNMKAVCVTPLENPAISTVQAICGVYMDVNTNKML